MAPAHAATYGGGALVCAAVGEWTTERQEGAAMMVGSASLGNVHV